MSADDEKMLTTRILTDKIRVCNLDRWIFTVKILCGLNRWILAEKVLVYYLQWKYFSAVWSDEYWHRKYLIRLMLTVKILGLNFPLMLFRSLCDKLSLVLLLPRLKSLSSHWHHCTPSSQDYDDSDYDDSENLNEWCAVGSSTSSSALQLSDPIIPC